MADQDPVFNIQRVYLKEASLEQPNSPAILLDAEQPALEINLGVNAENVAEGIFEVAVTATVTSKIADKTVFLAECKQAGIFDIRNVPESSRSATCPRTRWPASSAWPARRSSTPTCAATWPT